MDPGKQVARRSGGGASKAPGLRVGPTNVVLGALYEMIERHEDGARLPTVRDLMKTYQVSQGVVQEAMGRLRDQGLLTAQVGRGTYVVKGGAAARSEPERGTSRAVLDSLLILSNASMNERCALVQNHIVEKMSRHGSKVVQISYHHTGHLLEILGSIPNFDAAVLQSHYESIPVRLLHLLQQKCKAVVVDGHTVSGVDVDRVGTDWEDALEIALRHLRDLGHRSFGMVSLNTAAQPILAVRRAFARKVVIGRKGLDFFPPVVLQRVLHPTQGVCGALEESLAPLFGADGKLPFSALVTLGISDTLGLTQVLERLGIRWPEELSIVVLGHRDVPTEHLGVMTISGSSHQEAAQNLVETILRRIAEPELSPQIAYLQCGQIVGRSTARLVSAARSTVSPDSTATALQPG